MTDIPDPDREGGPDLIADFLGDISLNGNESRFESVSFEEAPPEPEILADDGDITTGFEDATVTIGDGSCIVCGAPTFRPPGLTKTGRKKRAPRYCDLHSPNSRVSAEGPDARRLESQLQRIQEELADDIKLGAVLAGPFFPVTGYYLYEQADPFTIALLKLCKNNTKALKYLHRAAQIAPIYTVAETFAGVAIAVQVDNKKHDPYSTFARRLGVTRAYDNVYSNAATEQTVNSTTNGMTPPPRYATVQ